MEAPSLIFTGPETGPVLVLAHGAGAPMDSPFMETFANGLGERGVRVARFEFPYMAARRTTGRKKPPDRAPVLDRTWRQVIDALGGPSGLVIGGKSMGGRLASMVAAALEAEGRPARGLVCLGYPFHRANGGEPRIEHLGHLATPTLICQGARDTMGWYDEVAEYPLSPAIRFCWLDDGDHDFKPRHLSGKTMRGNQTEAMDAIHDFMGDLPSLTSI